MPRVWVLVEPEQLDPESFRQELETEGCGSVVSFVGLTRGEDDGIAVRDWSLMHGEEKLPEMY